MANYYQDNQSPLQKLSSAPGGFFGAVKSAFQLPGALLNSMRSNTQNQMVNQQLAQTYKTQGINPQNPTVQRQGQSVPLAPVSPQWNPARPPAPATGYPRMPIGGQGTVPNAGSPIRPPAVNPNINIGVPLNSGQGNGGSAYAPQTDSYGNPTANNTNPTNGGTSQTQQPQQFQQAPDRFAQLTALENSAAQYNQPSQDEQDTMQQLGNLLSSRDLGIAKITNNPEPMPLLTGQSQFLQQQAAAQTQPLQAKLGILQARRQAAVQGYQQALGAEQAKLGFSQPVSLGLGQALVNPSTGQTVVGNASYTGGANGGAGSLIDSLAQQVNSGAAYNDVVAQLPSAALAPALLQAILKQNPNFNITQSNQNAGARAQQLNQNVTLVQPLKLAMNTALDHIKGLQDVVNKVGYSDSGLINNIRTGISDNFMSDQNIKSLQSQIGLVREEVAKVLGGGTATDSARADANAIIPMNISPSQFQAVIGQVQQRMQEKIDEYGKLGDPAQYGGSQSGQSSQTGSNSLYSF